MGKYNVHGEERVPTSISTAGPGDDLVNSEVRVRLGAVQVERVDVKLLQFFQHDLGQGQTRHDQTLKQKPVGHVTVHEI